MEAFDTGFKNTNVTNGLTMKDWRTGVLAMTEGSHEYSKAFNEVWKELYNAELIILCEGSTDQYRFLADAVRRHLGR
jgi:hypothetical protein